MGLWPAEEEAEREVRQSRCQAETNPSSPEELLQMVEGRRARLAGITVGWGGGHVKTIVQLVARSSGQEVVALKHQKKLGLVLDTRV
jgi:CRISPR/Cas system CSM-associated protein Csm5 (group 7 of RAMP superfamily)